MFAPCASFFARRANIAICQTGNLTVRLSSKQRLVKMPEPAHQLEVFPRLLHLRRLDPARNMRRYYRIAIESDLFGKSSLVREWGRIGSRGQMLVETHSDEGQAVNALMKLARAKERKGYVR